VSSVEDRNGGQEIDTIVAIELDRPAIQIEPLAIVEPANSLPIGK
jgi:hypothetical protein